MVQMDLQFKYVKPFTKHNFLINIHSIFIVNIFLQSNSNQKITTPLAIRLY